MKPLTPKQEKFCQLVAGGKGLSEAYRESYNANRMKPESVHRNAKAMMDNIKIASRVEVIREKHAKRHEITVDDLVRDLQQDREFAYEVGAASAAITATMGKGKLLGLLVDRTDNKHTHDFANLSDEDLKAMIASALGSAK